MGLLCCACKCISCICCCVFWAIMIPFIVGVVLILFFLIPRVPKYEVNYVGVNNYELRSDYMMLNVSYSVLVKNKNYIDLKFEGSELSVYHKDALVNKPKLPELTYAKRKDSTHLIDLIITTTDPAIIASIIAEEPEQTFNVKGFLRVVYIATPTKIDMNENFKVQMTGPTRREAVESG